MAIALVVVLAVTAIAFYPSLANGLTNWDDPRYVLQDDLTLLLLQRNP